MYVPTVSYCPQNILEMQPEFTRKYRKSLRARKKTKE